MVVYKNMNHKQQQQSSFATREMREKREIQD